MRLIGLVLATVFAIGATLAHAAGLELIEVPSGAEGRTLTGAVWYPCAAPAQPVKLSELLVVSAVKDCPIEGNAWPLVVISHGRTGNFFLHRDIAGALADAGFAVAAIYHPGDSSRDMSRTNDLSVLIERPADITRLVDFMLNTWAGARALDRERIGFFGFSRGGYTGLVEMGANPDFRGFAFCDDGSPDPICGQIRDRDPAKALTHDARFKAAVLADPALSRLFTRQGLREVTMPLQLWASEGGGDGVSLDTVTAIAKNLPSKADFHVVAHATHFSFATPCSPEQTKALPEICRDEPGFDRVAFHEQFNTAVLTFFRKHLGNTGKSKSSERR